MSGMNFSIEEELPIIFLKEYEQNSNVKGYHAYMVKWNPTLGEFLMARLELENILNKFAVAVEKCTFHVCIFHVFFVEAMKTLAKFKLLGNQ